MNKDKKEKLFNDFPNLYSEFIKESPAPVFKISFEDGWFNLIYELSSKISQLDPECIVIRITEEYGALKVYTGHSSKLVYQLICEYENKSLKVCKKCGSTNDIKMIGYSLNNTFNIVCDLCYKKILENKK